MTERPVFIPNLKGKHFVEKIYVKFEWFPGFAVSQYQKSINSLHENIAKERGIKNILEISTKSDNKLGVSTSAFNLMMSTKNYKKNSVESYYQGSKVFESGGPFTDIYEKNSYQSKKDERLKNSGKLKGFKFHKSKWGLDEYFYDYLYLNALHQNPTLKKQILEFDAFTDIAFNPKKSYNCQAYSAALYKSALIRKLDFSDIKDPKKFKKIFPKETQINIQQDLI